jgi:hypothetical protein
MVVRVENSRLFVFVISAGISVDFGVSAARKKQ